MGWFNTYGCLRGQMKVGNLSCRHYRVGDEVEGVPDGVYVTRFSVLVIKDGVFVAELEHAFTKWGDVLSPKEMLAKYDFTQEAVDVTIATMESNEGKAQAETQSAEGGPQAVAASV